MICKVCNTRVPGGKRNCPNCGVAAAHELLPPSSGPIVLPDAELSTARAEMSEDDVRGPDTSAPPAPPRAPVLPSAPAAGSNPTALRRLLIDDPELLEPGLTVYSNAEGAPLGASLPSSVGEIDLLAIDAAGRMVVVMISGEQDGESLVAQVLQRMGWVRKHVASAEDRVRGIVLCEKTPEGLSYSAAAVADTVEFKTWRVALRFDDLEL